MLTLQCQRGNTHALAKKERYIACTVDAFTCVGQILRPTARSSTTEVVDDIFMLIALGDSKHTN